MGTFIKVCGITSMEEAEFLSTLDINYVGFIFAPSKRKIEKEKAKDIISFIKERNPKIKAIGVFVNENINEVQEVKEYCKLDVLQLHGDEDKEYCKMLSSKIWKSISVGGNFNEDIFENYLVDGFLLDASGSKRGGNNTTFDWEKLRGIGEKRNIILAGGLNGENVIRGLSIIKPSVVDVNSGMEKNGKKDYQLVKEFVEIVRSMEV